jgi:hypothetical protein
MYCPGCGSNNTTQSTRCSRCGANLSAVVDLLAGRLYDKTAVAQWTGTLLKKYYSGRRDTIAGLLLLAGAFVIMRVLISTGMPPFIAFLWTCWMFFGGVIALAEGAGKWFASRGQIKVLGWHISGGCTETTRQEPGSEGVVGRQSVMLTNRADTTFEHRGENSCDTVEVRSDSWRADRQRGMMG